MRRLRKVLIVFSVIFILFSFYKVIRNLEAQFKNSGFKPDTDLKASDALTASGKLEKRAPPEHGNIYWDEARQYRLNYKVGYDGGIKITSELDEASNAKENTFKVSMGTFKVKKKGFYNREVWFYPGGAEGIEYIVLYGNAVGVYEEGGCIYLVAGHSTIFRKAGAIYKLQLENDKLVPYKMMNIEDEPLACTKGEKDTLYVVTHRKLIVIKDNKFYNTIFDDAFWEGMLPNSIVRENNNLYIGMKRGVAKIDLEKQQYSWYVE